VRGDLPDCSVTWLRILNLANVEMTAKLCLEELLSKLVNTLDVEVSSIGIDNTTWEDLVIGQVVISHET
jgi:hypothetical protein